MSKKGNLHLSYVLEDGLLGKYLVITPQRVIIEIFACPNRRFLGNYLSKRQVGQDLAKSVYRMIDFIIQQNLHKMIRSIIYKSYLLAMQSKDLLSLTVLNIFGSSHVLKPLSHTSVKM